MSQRFVVSITLFHFLCVNVRRMFETFLVLFFQDFMTRKIDPVGKEDKRVTLEVSAPFFL